MVKKCYNCKKELPWWKSYELVKNRVLCMSCFNDDKVDKEKIVEKQDTEIQENVNTNLFAGLMHLLAFILLIYGYVESTSADAISAFQQQVLVLWQIKYILLAIFCELLALNSKKK